MADNLSDALKALYGWLTPPDAQLVKDDYPTTDKQGRPVPSQQVFQSRLKAPAILESPVNPQDPNSGSLANAVPPPMPVEIRNLFSNLITTNDPSNITGNAPLLLQQSGAKNVDQLEADIRFNQALRQVENAGMAGRNDDGFWHPHESPEGGLPTLGYGHKLTKSEMANKVITLSSGQTLDFSDGLSDAEVTALLNDDTAKHRNRASTDWDSYYGKENKFSTLPREYQNVLTNIVFNTGSLAGKDHFQWPKLADSIIGGDVAGIRKNMMTYYTDPRGKQKPLKNRADIIASALGLVPLDEDASGG